MSRNSEIEFLIKLIKDIESLSLQRRILTIFKVIREDYEAEIKKLSINMHTL